MASFEEIAAFVRHQTGCREEVRPETSLQDDVGVYGDDMDDFLAAYAHRFAVDLSEYLWYFHTGEEGFLSIGGLIVPPPNARVDEIPITVSMLKEYSDRGRWAVEYPPHQLPKGRPDLRINQAFGIVLALLAVAFGIRTCVS
jgi:hypothetical protein